MDKALTLGSLFDGSGGFPLGGLLCGIHPVWASEIEPFPIRVTTKRLPWMKHLGDISQVNGAEIEPVSIVTFGSPCVGLSVAGKREGLKNHQSVLFFEAIRIIMEMREATNGKYPRWVAWENVPGSYSSNSGADFGEVLTQIARIAEPQAPPVSAADKWPDEGLLLGDGWSLAYRTLDAKWWVPQRRRRIYLVADFGSERAADILFEREGMPRNLAQGGFPWQMAAGVSEAGPGNAVAFEPGAVARLRSPHYYDEAAGTLRADMGDNQAAVAYSIGACASGGMLSSNPQAGIYETDTARTLDANGGNPACNQGGVAIVFGNGQTNQGPSDIAGTLNCMHDQQAVCVDCRNHRTHNVSGTLQAKSNGGQSLNFINPVLHNYIVRRLTPRECAKLQGMPADYCADLGTPKPTEEDIAFWAGVFETHRKIMGKSKKPKSRAQIVKWLRNPYTDTAEWKMWGNACALPCVVFVMQGLVQLYQETGAQQPISSVDLAA